MARLCGLLCLFLVSAFFSGCQGILGIEERGIDIAELTADGYDGCEPANGNCDGCTSEWHTCICEGWTRSPEEKLRAECAKKAPKEIREAEEEKWADYAAPEKDAGNPPPDDDNVPPKAEYCENAEPDVCLDCACESCPVAASACDNNTGCRAVLSCMMNAQCEAPMTPGSGCAEVAACSDLFSKYGGKDGKSARLLESLTLCIDRQGCECGEGDPNMPPPDCSPENGCTGCADCFGECRCSGKSDAQCKSMCTPSCSPLGGCSGCPDCVAQCLCSDGGDMQACENSCNPPPCSPNGGCTCKDCMSECICKGGTETTCTTQCAPVSCSQAGGCNCSTCEESCMCRGSNRAACDSQCATDPCTPGNNCICGDCYSECYCQGNTTEACDKQCNPGLCMLGSGCVECKTTYDECLCQGNPASLCTTPSMGSITCGTQQCFPYVPPPPETILPACCAGTAFDACGYDMDPLFGAGTGCAPLNARGDKCDQCPGTTPQSEPWYGNHYFDGCCRLEDNSCGYKESVLNLGCTAPRFVGDGSPAAVCDIACMIPAPI
jgi:hypothetical protein